MDSLEKVLLLFHVALFLIMIFLLYRQQDDKAGLKVKSSGFLEPEVEMLKLPTESKSKDLRKQCMTLLGKVKREME